jgi:hypothetical protein
VLDLETFFPGEGPPRAGDALNNLLASPGFAAWMEGEPLDVAALLYTRGQAAHRPSSRSRTSPTPSACSS